MTAALAVFPIRPSLVRKVLGELIPGELGVLTTDRFGAYGHLDPGRRQVCWAHLRRDIRAMAAERALRRTVCWREASGGTDSRRRPEPPRRPSSQAGSER